MVGLVDLLPLKKKVPVGDKEIEVSGIPSKFIASLLDRFPELRKMFADREIKVDSLMKMGPDIIAAVIAAGTVGRVPGENEKDRYRRLSDIEEQAQELALGDQLELISEIIAATFPRGLQPFLARLEGLGLVATSGATGKAQVTKLPSEYNGAFSSEGTLQKPPGSTPQGS